MSNQLVDVYVHASVTALEVTVGADHDLDTLAEQLRNTVASWINRGVGDLLEGPLVVVKAKVTPV